MDWGGCYVFALGLEMEGRGYVVLARRWPFAVVH